MNSVSEIERIAHDLISSTIQNGDPVEMEWAVHEIIKGQGRITGNGVPFYRLCARDTTWRAVKKAVDAYDQNSIEQNAGSQLVLSGFDYLQIAYTVERDGERVLIPTDQLSDEELLKRAAEYDKQAGTLLEHAKEIRQYVSKRETMAA